MKIRFGFDNYSATQGKTDPVYWDSQQVLNGHMLLMGKSGTGKTHTIKEIIHQMQETGGSHVRFHVLDPHGDIEIDGASTIKFSESTQYGFNPLEINPHPDFGGVRKRIQAFMSAINRTNRVLGSKQESTLRALLTDLYSANGFKETDSKTWKIDDGVYRKFPKKNPTLQDATKFASYKLKALYQGSDSRAAALLEQLNKKVNTLHGKLKKASYGNGIVEDRERMEADIEKLKPDVIALYADYVNSIKSGMELDDLIRYDSRDVLKSVVERLENLSAIGIFKAEKPPFDPAAKVWRYDIRSLSADEMKLFVLFRLEDIFYRALQRGVQTDIVEVVILDEAHKFFDDDPDNILSIISKEARKFGLALICASQSPTHFSEDFLSNVSTKIMLGIDQMFWDGAVRKLKVDEKALSWIVPHRGIVMQINNKGEAKSRWRWVSLRGAVKAA